MATSKKKSAPKSASTKNVLGELELLCGAPELEIDMVMLNTKSALESATIIHKVFTHIKDALENAVEGEEVDLEAVASAVQGYQILSASKRLKNFRPTVNQLKRYAKEHLAEDTDLSDED